MIPERPKHPLSDLDKNSNGDDRRGQISELVSAIVVRLLIQAEQDDVLRADVRSLAQAILAETNVEAEAPEQLESVSFADAGDEQAAPPPASELAKLLWPSKKPMSESELAPPKRPMPATTTEASANKFDLSLIEKRCRLKAEGLKWSVERQRRIGEGADFRNEIEPRDSDIISRAKNLEDCYLWMNHPSGPTPSNERDWRDAAGCFESLADVAKLIRETSEDLDDHSDVFERALDLMAEAQSAVRTAVAAIDGPLDADQKAAYNWLRETAAEQQVFIQRYMRSSEAAEPSRWGDLSNRIEQLDGELQNAKQAARLRRRRLKKVAYLVNKIHTDVGNSGSEHWTTLVTTVEELCSDGLPPSNRELRELLLPVIDDFPDDAGTDGNIKLVLREIDRFLASQPSANTPSSDARPTKEVQRVAKVLKGKKIVLIGGERRPHAQAALEAAFQLKELIWIAMREHESPSIFEPAIATPEVEVVLLAIRWSSHSYGEAKQYCDDNNKHFVRLKAGYNPNQVAVHIIDQCPSLFDAEEE